MKIYKLMYKSTLPKEYIYIVADSFENAEKIFNKNLNGSILGIELISDDILIQEDF